MQELGQRALPWVIATALIVAVVLAVWLLRPMPQDDRWAIGPDSTLLAGKSRYLGSLEPADVPRRNVVLIVADDLGRYDVGYHGASPIPTPNIDALAASGSVYANAYATAAICAPSRAALLTGRVQNRFGFESQPMQRYVRNIGEFLAFRYLIDTDEMQPFLTDTYPAAADIARQGLPRSEITLSEIFQRLGYATALIGKWHLGYAAENHPRQFGFDTQYGFLEAFSLYADPSDPAIVEHRHDLFWERHIWSMGRSGPSAITRDGASLDEGRYLTDAIAEETIAFMARAHAAGRPFFAYVPFSAPHTPFQARREDFDALGNGAGDPNRHAGDFNRHAGDFNRRIYLAMIRRLDHAVGRLVRHLRANGSLENTLIVFTSDNGGAAYTGATDNGPLRGGKFTLFDGGVAVPLVVTGPGIPAERSDRPVMLTDLFATLLDVAGTPLPADRRYDSVSLLGPPVSDRLLCWRSDFNRAVRAGQWKLLEDARSGEVRLYDIASDPGERSDLAGSNPAVVTRLRDALDRWEAELVPPRWPRVMNYRYADELDTLWFAI